MRVPDANYTLSTFLQYLGDHSSEVFGKEEERKWLKTYLIYSNTHVDTLANSLKARKQGDLYDFQIPARYRERRNTSPKSVHYYVHELVPGLLMFFTSSSKEDCERSLEKFIDFRRGMTQMWITYSSLEKIRHHLVSTHKARIYRFIARRNHLTETPAKVRPEYDRRLSYSGEDASDVLDETHDTYGVVPSSIDFRIGDDKLEVTNDGLFLLRHVNAKTLRIVIECINLIRTEQMQIKDTAEKFERSKEKVSIGNLRFEVPRITAGVISLSKPTLSTIVIQRLLGYREEWEEELLPERFSSDFSFVDVNVGGGVNTFSTTAVDEKKRAVFGVSGGYDRIILTPKYNTTFDSFVRFYRIVSEMVDANAQLSTFGAAMNAR